MLVTILAGAAQSSAVAEENEWPWKQRTCNSSYESNGAYRLDWCVSVGFHVTNHIGQVALTCRTGSGVEVKCMSMNVTAANLRGCDFFGSCSTIIGSWSDSVLNVDHYVSVRPSPSFDCLHSAFFGTKVVATLSVRFPDSNTNVGIHVQSDEESHYCVPHE
jgi:hypothetical protein